MQPDDRLRKESMKKLFKLIIRRNNNPDADIDETMSYFQFKEYITECVTADAD